MTDPAVIGALVGAIVLFLGGVTHQVITWFMLRPNLRILPELERVEGTNTTHFRLLVENKGRRVAENCVGVISIDIPPEGWGWVNNEDWAKIDANTFQMLGRLERETLFWEEGEKPYYLNINPGMKARLNIARFDYVGGEPYEWGRLRRVVIPSEEGWEYAGEEPVFVDGKVVSWVKKSRISLNIPVGIPANEIPYVFRIRVTSRNSNPTPEMKFRISAERQTVTEQQIEYDFWSLEQL